MLLRWHRYEGCQSCLQNGVSSCCARLLTHSCLQTNHELIMQVRWRRAAARVHARLLLRMVGGAETRDSHVDGSRSSDSSSCENGCASGDESDRSCTSDCSADAQASGEIFDGAFLLDAMASPLTAALHGKQNINVTSLCPFLLVASLTF